jgi:hypothetical protein
MPFALIVAGIALILVGYQGTQDKFFGMLQADAPQFIKWAVAIFVIGAIGYIPRLKDLSNAFLVLIILVMFISNQGFFCKLNEAIGTSPKGSCA